MPWMGAILPRAQPSSGWLTGWGCSPLLPPATKLAYASHDLDVVFVPALAGLAAPHWLPEARGVFFGLSRATTPADLVRAVLDGIAWRIYELVQAMQRDAGYTLQRLKVDGGPSANRYLMQNLADILQMEILVAANEEATAAGIAHLAGTCRLWHAALLT